MEQQLVKNIIKVFRRAMKAGTRLNWYFEANNIALRIARKHRLPVWKVAAVIAVTSVNTGWNENLSRAKSFLETGRARHFGHVQRKCEAIMAADHQKQAASIVFGKSGWKVLNFYHNILNPCDTQAVTVDRHAVRIARYALDDPGSTVKSPRTEKQYREAKQAYVRAADKLHLPASQVQSATWVYFREVNKINY